MDKKDKVNLGDDIKNKIQDALNSGDFKRLNNDIENVVKGALDEVRRSMGQKTIQPKDNYKTMDNYTHMIKVPLKSTKYIVPVGKVSGILYTVFGSIGTTAFGIAVTVLTLLGFAIGGEKIFHTIAIGLLPLLIISIISLINGNKVRKRLKRFQKYIGRMQSREYYLIRELSQATGLSDKATAKDLQKMISLGMFPEGHIDEKGTYFMLSNKSHEEYKKFKEGIRLKQLEEKQNKEITAQSLAKIESNSLKPEVRKAIDEGRKFIMEIKKANIAILGEEVSSKLDRLEEVTGKIFDYVEVHPEKLPEIKKFMEYFLPTTLKLLDAYKKLDYQPIEGHNIKNSKLEIEETIDTINHAFENLLDSLFEDLAMDISTDISVLETIFAQEGLIDHDLKLKK